MFNIGIVGLGYVGLTLSIIAAKKGFIVYGIDKDLNILSSIKNKKGHFFEKGLDEALSEVLDKQLFISDQFNSENDIDCFVITVGTPINKGSKEPDLNHIKSAIDSFLHIYTGKQLIILRSTVSVGTTRTIAIPKLCSASKIQSDEVLIAFCPERTVEGNALKELVEIPQIIGANNEESYKKANGIFKIITKETIKVKSIEAAELIKLFNNTYRDIHFSIGNYFNFIAQSFGLDGNELINAANHNYERSKIAIPGLVGGPCLEKDPHILVHNLKDNEGKKFVLGARTYNESMEDRIVRWVLHKIKKYNLKNIGVSGIAFKGKPDNSDIRGSSSLNIINKLMLRKVNVLCHDFIVTEKYINFENKVENDFYKFIEGLQMILILNNNHRYSSLDLFLTETKMKKPCIIFDCWNILPSEEKYENLNISTLGNMELKL
jgi:UDP-N-acetyl-D-mannosaminuronic acid dehydrogenase